MTNIRDLTIGDAAQELGISIDTLRRWDKNGKLLAKISQGGHRYYSQIDIDIFKRDLFALASDWLLGPVCEPESAFYCPTGTEFKGRLSKLQTTLEGIVDLHEYYSLIVAIVGEIGNNSFDHNIGNWPDIQGIFFALDHTKRQIALADRGQGILRTLKRVCPDIKNDEEALQIAFTEVISGRTPEARGNGLKFVLDVVLSKEINLHFYSGSASASIGKGDLELSINRTDLYYSGCMALIDF